MSALLNVDEKIEKIEKDRDMTESDLEGLFDSLKGMIKKGEKIGSWENNIDILERYTKHIKNLNKELNYLYQYKGEAMNK